MVVTKSDKKLILSFLIIGSAYYLVVRCTHFSIPCVFRLVTGWMCPGCGITTMIMALVDGRVGDAYLANPFLFVTMPLIVCEIGYMLWRRSKDLGLSKWNNILVWIYLVCLIVFGIVRNIL